MVWYPTVEDIIKANKRAVRDDRLPHKLRRSPDAIQSLISTIKESASMGLTYQAARFMKEIVTLHAFDGGNHRTAYSIANLFLIQNGVTVRFVSSNVSYDFAKSIGARNLGDVQEWIEQNMV